MSTATTAPTPAPTPAATTTSSWTDVHGLRTMAAIQWRTGWKVLLAWTFAVAGTAAVTAFSIAGLYNTPEKVASYAQSLGAGSAMKMLNGDIAGLDSLGGIIANEFGVLASYLIPVMGIALVVRNTRREEESGRFELLLAARIGRQAPLVAALLLAAASLLITGLLITASIVGSGVPVNAALGYGLAVAALGIVYAGFTAVAAQVFGHGRTVWAAALAATVAGVLVRGLGATNGNALVWLSPQGWFDAVRPFGDLRWWPLLISLAVAAGLSLVAVALSGRRDVGQALLPPRAAAPRASRSLRSPWGLALYEHRGTIVGWVAGAAVLMAVYGSLTNQVLEAIRSNPAMVDYVGGDLDRLLDGVLALFVLLLAMLSSAFVVQALAAIRHEEQTGRLESELSGQVDRRAWLGTHLAVVALGALAVHGLGALSLAGTTAAATGDGAQFGVLMRACAAYLPVLLFFAALTAALFGSAPRRLLLVWVVFGLSAFVSYMGPGLQLPTALIDSSPFSMVGSVPGQDLHITRIVVLSAISVALLVASLAGFRHRDVPTSG